MSQTNFDVTYCSQCGGSFGPRDSGYSHCEDHIRDAAPDLLEVVEFEEAYSSGDIETMIKFGWSPEGYYTGYEFAAKLRRAAIAKARGQ